MSDHKKIAAPNIIFLHFGSKTVFRKAKGKTNVRLAGKKVFVSACSLVKLSSLLVMSSGLTPYVMDYVL